VQGRHRDPARVAPARPEIEDDDLSEEGGEGDRSAVQCAEREVGGAVSYTRSDRDRFIDRGAISSGGLTGRSFRFCRGEQAADRGVDDQPNGDRADPDEKRDYSLPFP